MQWAGNSDIDIFFKEGPCLRQIRYFNLILGPVVYLVCFQTFKTWNFSLIFVWWWGTSPQLKWIKYVICNAVGQQVDQKYTATFSKNILIQAKLAILDLNIVCTHLHHERDQLSQPCLINPFNNNRSLFLFCNNTSNPQVLFIQSLCSSNYIFFFKKC